jgi:hypothetical protein
LSVDGSNPFAKESSSQQGADFLTERAKDSVWFERDPDGNVIWHMPGATGAGTQPSTGSGSGSDSGGGIVDSAASRYTPWNLTPDQTVEGRIQSIVNGAIGTQARTNATEGMIARGLQNSDLAISAGEQAAYAAAQPIAAADAATAAKAAGYNADIQNQMSMQGRQLGNAMDIAKLDAETSRYSTDVGAQTQRFTAGLSAETQKYVAGLNAQSSQLIAGMDNASRVQLQQMQNDSQTLLNTNSQAAQAWNQAMVAIANIEQNDKMDANAKQQAIAQIMSQVQMQMKTIGTVAGIDLSGTLDFRNMPGFDANGTWVGFTSTPADGGSPTTTTTNNGGVVSEGPGGM